MAAILTTVVTSETLSVAAPDRWRAVLPASRSAFGSVEFASIARRFGEYEPRLFVCDAGDAIVAYPFYLRGLADLPFDAPRAGAWDTRSPEFTGPIPLGAIGPAGAQRYAEAFSDHCRREGIVAEFAHLHPWNAWRSLLPEEDVRFDREIVYVDLTIPEQVLWHDSFTRHCRKNIQRAQREGVRVFEAESLEHIQAFHRVYTDTMQRNGAAGQYYFPLDYFRAFFDEMPGHALFLLAEYQGKIVAGTLYLHDDVDIYSYLGGADYDYQHVRPTNAIVHAAIRFGQRAGKRRLVLGGGYQPDDGIFRFKASFSPLRAPFHVYTHIHDAGAYDALCAAWSRHNHVEPRGDDLSSYFPAYRALPARPAEAPPAAGQQIPMAAPDMTDSERQTVSQVLATPVLSIGPRLQAFEEEFAAYVGVTHAIGVNSGTAGLHLAVIASDVQQDDLVITTPFSFVASANCILYERGVPVFVDVDPETGNIDPVLVAEAAHDLRSGHRDARRWLPPALRRRTAPSPDRLKAILPVHAFGQPADMDSLLGSAGIHGLRVIEDACEAVGAEYHWRKAGTLGDAAVFAFYPNKQMTTGEGGMLVTDDAAWDSLFRSLRNQGRDEFNAWLQHTRLGYNYRMDEMSAALGLAQVRRIEDLLDKRARVAGWYNERLAGSELVRTPAIVPATTRMSWFVYVVRLAAGVDRDEVMRRLAAAGVPSRPYFTPIHLQPFYRDRFGYQRGDFPHTEYLGDLSLALPFSGVMTESQVDYVCEQLAEAAGGVRTVTQGVRTEAIKEGRQHVSA